MNSICAKCLKSPDKDQTVVFLSSRIYIKQKKSPSIKFKPYELDHPRC